MNINVINVVAELEAAGVEFEVKGDSVRTRCPFHDDSTPSCMLSISKRVFKCMAGSCGAKGGILKYLARLLNLNIATLVQQLATRYAGLIDERFIDPTLIEEYHNAIWVEASLLAELRIRGVTDGAIREHRLGAHKGRITIPIRNHAGMYVNVRYYLPGGPPESKMKNMRGFGQPDRLFPLSQMKYDSIIVCGGEIKAIATADIANAFNIGAVSSTGGESRWLPAFNPAFVDKRVWVCFDIDAAGRKGAESVCANLKIQSRWVGNIELPLDIKRYPKGDINDWIGREHATANDLKSLLDSTPEWTPKPKRSSDSQNGKAIGLTLQESSRASTTGHKIVTHGVISAIGISPYVVPKTVRAICDRSQGELCVSCPVFMSRDDRPQMQIHPESPFIIEMVDAPKKIQRSAIIGALDLPPCKVVSFEPIAYYNVDDVRLTPRLELSDRTSDRTMQPALCVDASIELNETYQMHGRMWPHPKTQQATLLLSEAEPIKTALDNDAAPTDNLTIFQGEPNTKLAEIYADFEDNVTGIRMRRDMHLVMDLAWHSVLLYKDPETGRIEKGWVEVLVMGDSSQGKSEIAKRLIDHYGCGEKLECKNATVAGLLGGLQQIGTRWFVTWGAIPSHDRRLLVLEELKGAPIEVISKLTDMRSSGVAEIPKIERRRTHARTRLIAISNPRSSQPISSYSFGVLAVKELIGGLEDIRRFDAVCTVASEEIDVHRIHISLNTPHIHTSKLCHALALWAWTRQPHQIKITTEASENITKTCATLCDQYVEELPIVDRGSMRHKVTRLAIALACRLFSTDDGVTVIVKQEHIACIYELLQRLYSSKACGYSEYTQAVRSAASMIDVHLVRARIRQTPFPRDLIEQLLSKDTIELQDLQDWCGWERGNAQQLLSFLVRKHGLQREGRAYRKSAGFVELLRGMRTLDLERPDYVDEKDEF